MSLRTFYYVTVRDVPGFSNGYLRTSHGVARLSHRLSLLPEMFLRRDSVEFLASDFTERYGGTAKVIEVQLQVP